MCGWRAILQRAAAPALTTSASADTTGKVQQMNIDVIGRRARSLGIGGAIAAIVVCLSAAPALAHTVYDDSGLTWGDTSSCAAQPFSQPFSQPFVALHDANWYTLVPGQSPGEFTGDGWTLDDGASIQAVAQPDGTTASVLDLPSGASAVSPPMCVETSYPTARTVVRNVVGGDGVQVFVAYAGTKSESNAQGVGAVHGNKTGWSVSPAFSIHPGNLPGWQLVRFTLVAGGHSSDFQIDNFWVDPRIRW